MKKTAFFALAALALLSCQREVNDPQVSNVPTYTVTITARLAETRTAYDDAGKFSWVAGDKIDVLVSDGTTKKLATFTTAEAGPEVPFTGEVPQGFQVTGDAAYALDFDASKQKWVLPQSVTVDPEKPLSSLPLFGAADSEQLYQFKTATGILKFTVENAPVETASVSLETVGDDAPALSGELAAAPAEGVVTMAALTGGKKLVSVGAPAEANTTMTYWFFVPAGTLPAEKTVFSVCDASENVIKSLAFQKAVEVAANRITNIAPVHFEPVKVTNRQTDSLALVALYNASKGAEWTKGNWDLSKDMSTWTGVTLTGGRVTALKLTTTVAIPESWTLPDEIADLTALTDLRINKQKLTGGFPTILCSMDWLKVLYLQGNNFTGALPAELGQMTELTDLYVDQNTTMTGSIPREIGNLKKLQRLNISQSGIGGEIPVELGQCEELLQFMAFKCQLSGTLPDIWDLPKLQTFMVHTNPGLTGKLPASLGKLKKIATAGPSIQVHSCNFTGNIPESFAELDGGEKKVQVHLYGNQMSGVVPASVQAHKDFSSWKISPQQEGFELRLQDYSRQTDSLALVAIYNASKGAEWTKGNWELDKDMSTWTGVTLTGGRVTALKLTTTVAIPESWTLPNEILSLSALTDLRINKQKLSGDFPTILCRMDWLKVLYLQGNNFTGALPAELGQMTELTDLYVDQNTTMTGSIPREIGNLKKLQRLNISQSGIGGEIPVELGQCEELLQFMAFKCGLSGTLPDIWDMPKLQTFMVHTNPGLTGELPASLGKLKKIATAGPSIQVHSCNITGNIPESFAELDGGEKKVQVHVYGNQMTGVIPASVQAHKDFSSWKINPQQDGFGLTLE